MAISSTTLVDKTREASIRATGVASETDGIFIDVSALSKFETGGLVAIRKLVWSIVGAGLLTLQWEASSDVTIATIGGNGNVDFAHQVGTLQENNAGAGITGDISITTDSNVTGYTIWAQVVKVSGFEAPAVITQTRVPDAAYVTGNTMDTVVTFDEPVIVSTSGGTPSILYTMDACDAASRDSATTCKAIYTSGNNTNHLTFRRTVLAGDDENGSTAFFASANIIVLNSGTILSKATSKAIDLTLAGYTDDGGITVNA